MRLRSILAAAAALAFLPSLANATCMLLMGVGGPCGLAPSTAWTPGAIQSQLPVWLDAADGSTVTLSGSDVTAWASKGATSYSVTPGGGGAPTLVTADLNGKNVFNYNPSNSEKFTSPGTVTLAATTLTTVVVAKRVTTTAAYQGLVGMNVAFATGWGLYFTGATQNNYLANDLLVTGAGDASTSPKAAATISMATDASYHLVTGEVGATTALYQDGNSGTTAHYAASGTFSTLTDTLYVGWTNSSGDFFNGNIAEIVVCADCSSANVSKVEGYLAWKWGLQGNLPLGHPYKSAAP